MNAAQLQYVPVLKVKRAEKRALIEIDPSLTSRITPLLEIVQKVGGKTLDQHLDTAFKDLDLCTRPYPRCFLDCRELEKDGPAASEGVFRRAAHEGIAFVPVTGLSRASDVGAAVRNRKHGLAIRLTRSEFEGGVLGGLNHFLSSHRLTPEDIDLIVDLGPLDDLIAPGVATLTNMFLGNVPNQTRWRTLTLSACAFPSSMGGVPRNSYDFVERTDWTAWRDHLYRNRQGLLRLPIFSDCAIQHTSGVEGFDPRIMQASASVRYTSSDSWLLIKGESTRITPPTTQFPFLASRLAFGDLQQYFDQEIHCSGCSSIWRCAQGWPRLASPESWRRFGTIHHITRVMQDLAALP